MAGTPLPPLGPLTQSVLRSILRYDPETGRFTWLVARKNTSRVGRIAGGVSREGYWRIWIDGYFYGAHRLAWLYMVNEWPPDQIDHANGNTLDNRFCNLRRATQTQNKANSRVYKNNKLGVKGVRLHRNGRFEARLRVNGKPQYLGCYRTLEEAKAVYDSAAQGRFGEFARSA